MCYYKAREGDIMSKYPISKDYGIFRFFRPPVFAPVFPVAAKFLSAPSFLFKDDELDVTEKKVKSYDGYELTVYLISPKGIKEPCSCLVNYHGGGFVFEGAFHHYRLAMLYAKRAGCRVIYVKYRLGPRYKFPVPMEDCYAVLRWAYENAEALGIDRDNLAVGGDSAGGTLSAAVCLMNRDRGGEIPVRFQLLVYPFLDMRNNSASARKYTDTPMWNSVLSAKIKPMLMPDGEVNLSYISPVESESLSDLPPAYIETAEFDCLHDDGILYADLLKKEGTEVELFQTKGTMHGYDIALKAPMTVRAVKKRTDYMKKSFALRTENK